MKKVLLVDTNRAAVPIYRALCEMGHEVWVVGGKPTEPLARLAPNYVELDYSDVDRLAAFVEKRAFDYLVPGCTDLSYHVCAEVNMGRFPGIDTPAVTSTINVKNEFRKLADQVELPVPRVLSPLEARNVEGVIVKPVDSFSGRGVTVLSAPSKTKLNEALDVARKASKTGETIIEEFISGQLFSHSAFVWNGKVIADFIVQEDCTTNPFAVDTSRVATGFSGETLEAMRESVLRLSAALQLTNGLLHTQFIVSGNRYWIIEMTRRCPGDLYSLLIEFSTGFPYAASYAAAFVEEVPLSWDGSDSKKRITRHTVTSKGGASLWGFSFSQLVDIQLFVPLATSGEFIDVSPDGRAGIFFFRSKTEDSQKELYQKLLDGDLYSFS